MPPKLIDCDTVVRAITVSPRDRGFAHTREYLEWWVIQIHDIMCTFAIDYIMCPELAPDSGRLHFHGYYRDKPDMTPKRCDAARRRLRRLAEYGIDDKPCRDYPAWVQYVFKEMYETREILEGCEHVVPWSKESATRLKRRLRDESRDPNPFHEGILRWVQVVEAPEAP